MMMALNSSRRCQRQPAAAAVRPGHGGAEAGEHKDATELKLAKAMEQAARLRFRVTTVARVVGTALCMPGGLILLARGLANLDLDNSYPFIQPFWVPGNYLWMMLILPTRPEEVKNVLFFFSFTFPAFSLQFINLARDPVYSHSPWIRAYCIIVVSLRRLELPYYYFCQLT